jgi:hypothetical protein
LGAEKFPLSSWGGGGECPGVRTRERGPPSASAELCYCFNPSQSPKN